MSTFPYPIILGSTSPRRHELLNQCQIPHARIAIEIDETQFYNEKSTDYITRMVSVKANKATNVIDTTFFDNNNAVLLITADTIGVLKNGQILQKPKDFADACQMWQQMSNTTHEVWTAVQVSKVEQKNQQTHITQHLQSLIKTNVQFISLTEQMMNEYWHTGEPHDKAGAYAIQGIGAMWVKAIEGSYSNVVGLPIVETVALLKSF